MDAVTDRDVHTIIVVKASQVGWTECLGNILGYHVDHAPGPILAIFPTVEVAESWSKERLAPMLRDTPVLREKVLDPTSRSSENTIRLKTFPGGYLAMVGSNAPSGLAMRPIRIVVADEVDRFEASAGTEGDPLALARKRQTALALDTPLPTPLGWATVGEVRVGDVLFDEQGQECRVRYTTPIFDDHQCYRVQFDDGVSIIADAGHLWEVTYHNTKKPKLKILPTDQLLTQVKCFPTVCSTHPLATRTAELLVDPYILGVWLGDGHSRSPKISAGYGDANELAGYLKNVGANARIKDVGRGVAQIALDENEGKARGWRSRDPQTFLSRLRQLGVMRHSNEGGTSKHIPQIYLRAGQDQRLALLQGLMDTDGSISEDGRCRFSSSLPVLIADVKELLSSLGIKFFVQNVSSKSMVCPKNNKTYVRKPSWMISFYPTLPVFRLNRKATLQREVGRRGRDRRIVSVVPVPSVPVKCIAVDSPRNLFLAGREMIPTHNTFWNRKTLLGSSPGTKSTSLIWREWLKSDQRKFYVPCLECGHAQTLCWKNVRWDKAVEGELKPESDLYWPHKPETAYYVCEGCGTMWDDVTRWNAVSQGKWEASESFSGVAGFHIPGFLSPWLTLSDIVKEFLTAKDVPELLQVWVNTVLGEPWEEEGEIVEASLLTNRGEAYGPESLPPQVRLIAAGVDVQANRLECVTIGFGFREEMWYLAHDVLVGDPSQSMIWDALDQVLLRKYHTQDGRELRVRGACVDSGYLQPVVLAYCRTRLRRHILPIKGADGPRALWPKSGSRTKNRETIFTIGTYAAKDTLYGRLRIHEPGPGYVHFPVGESFDVEFFKQLTSERAVTRYKEGRPYRVWTKAAKDRNEVLDASVYALAARASLPIRINDATPVAPSKPMVPETTVRPVMVEAEKQHMPVIARQQQPRFWSGRRTVRSSYMD